MSDIEAERDLQIALLLDEAMAEWRAHGRLDESVWRARYPDLADEIPGLLDTLRALDTAASDWKLLSPPGTVAAPPPTAGAASSEPPDHVGRYRLLESIGVGGMGAVYRAEDPQLSRVVAVKFPRLDTPPHERARALQRFLREARAAARVRHPHICPIYDVGEEGGWPYVVMALVEGPSLAERLSHGRYDDLQAAAALAGQVAEALAAVHSHGIVHRDLKPANILLDADGRAVLTDFGLAYPSDDAERLTAAGVVVGTPAYMAPEQASGESSRVGPAADVYSLGVVLYQMVTGRLPYEGPVLGVLGRILSTPPPPPSQFRPGLDPALEGVILKAMARRPKDRFANARALADALRRWAAGQPTLHEPPARDAAEKRGPAVVRVDLPDGNPVIVSVDHGAAAPGKVAVSVREGRAVKGKRRRLAVTVIITFVLLIGVGLAASAPFLAWSLWSAGRPYEPYGSGPPWGDNAVTQQGTEFPKPIEIQPDLAPAHNNLGLALYDKGQLDEAIAEFRKALQIQPEYAPAHNNLGLALYDKGQLDEASAEYRKALQIQPDYAEAHSNLGLALQDNGQLDEAIAEFRKALQIQPEYTQARIKLGNALDRAERDALLPVMLRGEAAPADAVQQVRFAGFCQRYKRLYATASRFYADAFTAEPELANDQSSFARYNAACTAALAGCGQGEDAATTDAKERGRWRSQALDWLRADLALWTKKTAYGTSEDRAAAAATLSHWQEDAALAGVRDADALAKLPAEEQDAWRKLWADVDDVLQKAQAK